MMDQSISYILFRYVGEISGEYVAAVAFHPSENGFGKLSIHTLPGWNEKYQDGESLQMAHSILNDWKGIPTEEAPAVFEDLQDMSLGPFTADCSGQCSPNELPSVLSKFGLNL